jgi:UDP-2,3-diacylglucosamine pyrophosphatase LpxH
MTKNSFNRLLVVFSDIEMGAGGPTDDFPQSDFLGNLILKYNDQEFAEYEVDIILNGDVFDFLKTSYQGEYPHFINSNVALGKLTRIAGAHPKFFEAVRKFLQFKGPSRRLHFIVGNHDQELFFPEVQQFLKTLCGNQDQIFFPGLSLDIGAVHIEHGSQFDPLFRIDPLDPFVIYEGDQYLKLPWASVAILDVMMPHHKDFYHLERIKPKEEVLKLLPEMKEWVAGSFWRYWTQDFLRDYLKTSHPLKRVSWSMLKEVMRRFSSFDASVSMGGHFQREVRKDGAPFQLYLAGHEHEPGWWNYGNRKVLQTGCFRNEYMCTEGGNRLLPINKTYAEVYLQGARIVRSQIVEVEPPPTPEGYIPGSIASFRPRIQELLALQAEKERVKREIEKQEKEEKRLNKKNLKASSEEAF